MEDSKEVKVPKEYRRSARRIIDSWIEIYKTANEVELGKVSMFVNEKIDEWLRKEGKIE